MDKLLITTGEVLLFILFVFLILVLLIGIFSILKTIFKGDNKNGK